MTQDEYGKTISKPFAARYSYPSFEECPGGSRFSIASEPALLIGSESQVAWAEEIRIAVNLEFDRVSHALEARSAGQSEQQQADILTMLQILEEKRAEVMAHDRAGYFIKEWQERGDQVRLRIVDDPRCKAISERKRAARVAALIVDLHNNR